MSRTVIVTGSRDWDDKAEIYQTLDAAHLDNPITLIVQGGARGADELAESWAVGNDIPNQTFPADWKRYGKSAGMRRNIQMLEAYPNADVYAFPKGRSPGTRGCMREASERGHFVWITEGE